MIQIYEVSHSPEVQALRFRIFRIRDDLGSRNLSFFLFLSSALSLFFLFFLSLSLSQPIWFSRKPALLRCGIFQPRRYSESEILKVRRYLTSGIFLRDLAVVTLDLRNIWGGDSMLHEIRVSCDAVPLRFRKGRCFPLSLLIPECMTSRSNSKRWQHFRRRESFLFGNRRRYRFHVC